MNPNGGAKAACPNHILSIYDLLSREALDEREGFTREIGTKEFVCKFWKEGSMNG